MWSRGVFSIFSAVPQPEFYSGTVPANFVSSLFNVLYSIKADLFQLLRRRIGQETQLTDKGVYLVLILLVESPRACFCDRSATFSGALTNLSGDRACDGLTRTRTCPRSVTNRISACVEAVWLHVWTRDNSRECCMVRAGLGLAVRV